MKCDALYKNNDKTLRKKKPLLNSLVYNKQTNKQLEYI